MSGVGKGIAAASIGKILQARGMHVTALKIDPYVNVDAGTMNPTEHGEVFVLDDGMECDQDMGNYERFLNRNFTRSNYMTTGSIYLSIIERERNLEFGGRCVEVVPDVPLEVIRRIKNAAIKSKADVVVTEIGGTAGEYQNILFLEAVRTLKVKQPSDVVLVLVSFIPTLGAARTLNAAGLQADLILARAPVSLDEKRKEKLAFVCGLASKNDVISAPNVQNIYQVPLNFEKDKLSDRLLKKLNLRPRTTDLKEWRAMVSRMNNAKKTVKIGIVGKYFDTGEFMLEDSYISVIEAVKHGAAAVGVRPEIQWLSAVTFEKNPRSLRELKKYDGVIVPGGFGSRGVEGKIAVARYCRENKIPYFGLCYGMQIAVVEFARHVLRLKGAHTTEIDASTKHPVIDILPEQKKNLAEKNYGATMRLGAYPANLRRGTKAYEAYKSDRTSKSFNKSASTPRASLSLRSISERHRHRYEVNPAYIPRLLSGGMVFSGESPDRRLMEIMELPGHPFFMGTQFHPELKSRPLNPHPLFTAFLKAAAKK